MHPAPTRRPTHRWVDPAHSNARQLAVAATAIAVSIAVVSSLARGWTPISDQALMALRVRDVPLHLPLVGPWSRFGWNHPGPAQFYWLAPFYWLVPRMLSSSMLLVGTIAMNVVFGLTAWKSAREVSPVAGALAAVAAMILAVTAAPTTLRDPWNPWVAMLGALALCCAAWGAAEHRRTGTLALLPMGSFMVQAHIVNGPVVVAVVAVATIASLTNRQRSVPWRDLALGAAIAAAMWVPPVIQQITGSPGNISSIVSHPGEGPKAGWRLAARVVSNALGPVPDVLNPVHVSENLLPVYAATIPVWGIVLLVAVVSMVRRRDWQLLRGATIAVGALAGVFITVAELTGLPANYLVVARRGVVVFVLVICVHELLSAMGASSARTTRVMYLTCAAMAVILGIQQAWAHNPMESYATTVQQFANAVDAAHLPHELDVTEVPFDLYSPEVSRALFYELERRGYAPTSSNLDATLIGAHRVDRPASYRLLVTPVDSFNELEAAGWQILAFYDPFTTAEREQLAELKKKATAAIKLPDELEGYRRIQRLEKQSNRIRRGRVDVLLVGRPIP